MLRHGSVEKPQSDRFRMTRLTLQDGTVSEQGVCQRPRCVPEVSHLIDSYVSNLELADWTFFVICCHQQSAAGFLEEGERYEFPTLAASYPSGKGAIMKRGMIELLVLLALFVQGPIVNLANTMETNQSPQPSPGPTDPLPKPTSPSPGPPEPKLSNQILPCT
jgi:hypothetical protein